MKVTLMAPWFAPSEKVQVDKLRSFSGRRFDRGVHYMPDELLEHLPKSAIVEEGPVDYREVKLPNNGLVSADQARAVLEAVSAAHEEADKKLANKRAAMEKARQAKAEKREAAAAE